MLSKLPIFGARGASRTAQTLNEPTITNSKAPGGHQPSSPPSLETSRPTGRQRIGKFLKRDGAKSESRSQATSSNAASGGVNPFSGKFKGPSPVIGASTSTSGSQTTTASRAQQTTGSTNAWQPPVTGTQTISTGNEQYNEITRTAFFSAIHNNDVEGIKQLIDGGSKPQGVDENGISPANFLINQYQAGKLSKASATKLYKALCSTSNPTAPEGYAKPFARHGTWNIGDILKSGSLRGTPTPGTHGESYIPEKVFLTTPTPVVDKDFVVRDSRHLARKYGNADIGALAQNNDQKAYSVYAQAFSLLDKAGVQLASLIKADGPAPRKIYIDMLADTNQQTFINDAAVAHLTKTIQANVIGVLYHREIRNISSAQYQQIFSGIKLPHKIDFVVNHEKEVTHQVTSGDVHAALAQMRKNSSEHETSLAALNRGAQVPTVLGFSPVTDLKTHQVHELVRALLHQYRETALPLSGDNNGGKLVELEMRTPEHLSTLLLHAELENYALPKDAVVRLKKQVNDSGKASSVAKDNKSDAQKAEKAVYLSGPQLDSFKMQVKKEIDGFLRNAGVGKLENLDRLQRQELNDHLQATSGNILKEGLTKNKANFSNRDPLPGINQAGTSVYQRILGKWFR